MYNKYYASESHRYFKRHKSSYDYIPDESELVLDQKDIKEGDSVLFNDHSGFTVLSVDDSKVKATKGNEIKFLKYGMKFFLVYRKKETEEIEETIQ